VTPHLAVQMGHEDVERLLRNAYLALDRTKCRSTTSNATLTQAGATPPEFLGVLGALYNWLAGKSPEEILRAALEGLKKDQSFDMKHADDTYQRIDELVSPDIDIVITGHTHQQRALRRKRGGGYYYNSGTWVRLIRLSDDLLGSAENFQLVIDAFRAKTIKVLDDLKPPLVLRKPAVVSIVAANGAVSAVLNDVGGSELAPVLIPVEDSRFAR
jgi:hypothetical protein